MTDASTLPMEDRIPTFAEIVGFDAGAAWDRLTPDQQRDVGMLAVTFVTIGKCDGYFHATIGAVRKGFMTSHWTPDAQACAVWPANQIEIARAASDHSFTKLCNAFEDLWPALFGWIEIASPPPEMRDTRQTTSLPFNRTTSLPENPTVSHF